VFFWIDAEFVTQVLGNVLDYVRENL
jgi:hypothetical protein